MRLAERPQFMRSRDLWPLAIFTARRRGRLSALPSEFRLPVRMSTGNPRLTTGAR
jgi:hypothetical protein